MVMVFFRCPHSCPESALEAVKTALDMRKAIGALTEKWRRLGHELGFGVGIAHGFATLGTMGFGDFRLCRHWNGIQCRLSAFDEAKPGQT